MKIVLVDDQQGNINYLNRVLVNYDVASFLNPEEALHYCTRTKPDLLVTDQKMAGLTGLELVKKVKAENNDIYAIIISAYTDTADLIDAINLNLIYKYLVKPFSADYFLQNVHRALEMQRLERQEKKLKALLENKNIQLKEELTRLHEGKDNLDKTFLGENREIQKVREECRRYADSEYPILIQGETGTGKEILAREIHRLSPRSKRKFVAVNCAALNDTILESELFGHKKGSFTDARTDKKGLIEMADRGTLFLDEIGDASPGFQAKLLRVIQFGTFLPVGGIEEKNVRVRIISATNAELKNNEGNSEFRRDLYYRLSTHKIAIPPLRSHPEDMEILIRNICSRHGLSGLNFQLEALRLLKNHPFPGNVRELENLLFNLDLTIPGNSHKTVTQKALAATLEQEKGPETKIPAYPFGLTAFLEEQEKEIIISAFSRFEKNVSRTARALLLSRQGLRKKMVRFGLLNSDSDEQKK